MFDFLRFAGAWRVAASRSAALALAVLVGLPTAGSPAAAQLPDRTVCDAPAPDFVQEDERVAPRLVGGPVETAEQVLRRYQVEWRRIEVASAEPPGLVVNQWPKPGEPIAGQNVLLCISAGEPPPLMPDLRGSTLDQARSALAERRISATPDIRYSEHPREAGTIFDQRPEPGSPVTEATPIVLSVAQGPATPPVAPPPSA